MFSPTEDKPCTVKILHYLSFTLPYIQGLHPTDLFSQNLGLFSLWFPQLEHLAIYKLWKFAKVAAMEAIIVHSANSREVYLYLPKNDLYHFHEILKSPLLCFHFYPYKYGIAGNL